MISTNCCPGSISENAVYSQDEIDDRITTASADEGISVCAGSVNVGSIPAVWQLVGTDGRPGCISENTIYGQYEVDNRITTASADEGISVSAGGIDIYAVPTVW